MNFLFSDPTHFAVNPNTGYVEVLLDSTDFYLPVYLPNGATITNCVVKGSLVDGSETWEFLKRAVNTGDAGTRVATDNINVASSPSPLEDVDNSAYVYWIRMSTMDDGDKVFGAQINYTTSNI